MKRPLRKSVFTDTRQKIDVLPILRVVHPQSLKSNCDAILNKAKPKPKEEPPKEAETKTGEANASDPKDDKMEDGTTPAGDTPSSEPGTAKPDVEMELD